MRFWVRKTDLERLFEANRICYLIGGYDGSGNYGDIVQLAANLERLNLLRSGILPVPLINGRCIESHEDLCRKHTSLFGDGCFVHYLLPDGSERPDAVILQRDDLFEFVDPPPVYSQILIYGGGFFNDWWEWGKAKLDVIEAVQDWLGIASEEPDPNKSSLIVSGQQIEESFLSGAQSRRFRNLLQEAYAIGVRDELSFEAISRQCQTSISSNLFHSGDDAAPYIMARALSREVAERHRLPPAREGGSNGFTVNMHVSLENYVTRSPNRLFEIAVKATREVREACGQNLVVNLIIAYEDRRISETRNLERLKAAIAQEGVGVNIIDGVSELRDGFPGLSEGDVTVSCSYHIALTSLLLSIPTVLLYDNEYYKHKMEGLGRAFGIPNEMMFDIESGTPEELGRTLEKAATDRDLRMAARGLAARGAAGMALKSSATASLLIEFLTSGYLADLEKKYQSTVEKLRETLEQLSDLQFDYMKLLNLTSKAHQAGVHVQDILRSDTVGYQQLIRRIREIVHSALPSHATVIVVSKGDDELLNLSGRRGWHFPQNEDGVYVGYHPAHSAAAIAQLEALRAKGADYLLFPSTALWWLEYYAGFKQHLESHYSVVARQEETCLIFALNETAAMEALRATAAAMEDQLEAVKKDIRRLEASQRTRDVARATLPPHATVIVVSEGDDELLDLDGRRGWHFPQTENGDHTSSYPANSAEAIAQLEALRAEGGEFLLFPSAAFWWLDHYAEFKQHLDAHYRPVWGDECCLIYELSQPDSSLREAPWPAHS